MHRHIPNKRLTTRPSDPSWRTPECTAAVQAKRRSYAWDRLHKYPFKENKDLYKTHCARCVACLHNAKDRALAAVRQRLKSGSLQDKQWWPTLKAAGGDGRQYSIPVIRDDKGNEHTTSMDKGSCFGRHFSAKCSVKEDLQQSNLPHVPRRCNTVLSQVRFRPTTVRQDLKKLDVSKATGPDGIPARVLKHCAAELSLPLVPIVFPLLSAWHSAILKVARNEVENASFAQRSSHRNSRIWRPGLIEPAAECKRRARRRRPTFKSAYPDPQIFPQCNISSNYPLQYLVFLNQQT